MTETQNKTTSEKLSEIAKKRRRDKGKFKNELTKVQVPTASKSSMKRIAKGTEATLRISEACKAECDRQHVGPLEHGYLIEAYSLILTKEWKNKTSLALCHILQLSAIIEPEKAKGLRRTPVTFANGTSGLSPDLIPRALDSLLENQKEMPIDAVVKEFLIIHPFLDGNGRTAFVLYNLLSGNLDYPAVLPDYFG